MNMVKERDKRFIATVSATNFIKTLWVEKGEPGTKEPEITIITA